MSANVPITAAYGDGIGPEIMEASLHIIQEARARIDRVLEQGLEIVKTETLRNYNGSTGYTLSQ
jgi:isocitrate/isopropylmalate dehydrogenase